MKSLLTAVVLLLGCGGAIDEPVRDVPTEPAALHDFLAAGE